MGGGSIAMVCARKPAARRRPKADDPEQDRPTLPGTPWVRRGAVAASPSEGDPCGRDVSLSQNCQ